MPAARSSARSSIEGSRSTSGVGKNIGLYAFPAARSSARNSIEDSLFTPGIAHNTGLHALLAARSSVFLISAFPVHSIFFPNPLLALSCPTWLTGR